MHDIQPRLLPFRPSSTCFQGTTGTLGKDALELITWVVNLAWPLIAVVMLMIWTAARVLHMFALITAALPRRLRMGTVARQKSGAISSALLLRRSMQLRKLLCSGQWVAVCDGGLRE